MPDDNFGKAGRNRGIASQNRRAGNEGVRHRMPDLRHWVAAHPEHRLEQRKEESREAQVRRRRKRLARRVGTTLQEPTMVLS